MSLVLVDGFDDGLYASKWTAITAGSFPSTGGRNNSGYYQAWPSGDPRAYKSLDADGHATVGLACGFNNAGQVHTWDNFHFGADAAVTKHIGVRLYEDGSVGVNRGGTYGGTQGTELVRSAGGLFTNGVWNHIEIKVVLHDTTGAVVVRLNNAEIINFSGDTKNAGTEAVIGDVSIGSHTGGTYVQFSVDDVVIWNGAGVTNNNFIGDCSVRTLYPSGNGNSSQLVGSDANSTDNYLLVDEAGAPSTADYVGSSTPGQKDTYAYSDVPATGSVKGVVVRTYAAKSDAGAIAARNLTRIGGTDYASSDLVLATGYSLLNATYETSPATSVAWTPTEVNAAEFGFEVRT